MQSLLLSNQWDQESNIYALIWPPRITLKWDRISRYWSLNDVKSMAVHLLLRRTSLCYQYLLRTYQSSWLIDWSMRHQDLNDGGLNRKLIIYHIKIEWMSIDALKVRQRGWVLRLLKNCWRGKFLSC